MTPAEISNETARLFHGNVAKCESILTRAFRFGAFAHFPDFSRPLFPASHSLALPRRFLPAVILPSLVCERTLTPAFWFEKQNPSSPQTPANIDANSTCESSERNRLTQR